MSASSKKRFGSDVMPSEMNPLPGAEAVGGCAETGLATSAHDCEVRGG